MSLWKKKLRGVHVNHSKNTKDYETERMPVPDMVYISMSQHIGAPCTPLVKPGDDVKVGQLIGDTEAFVSAPVHSSVSGKVSTIEPMMSSLGTKDLMVVIKSDKKQEAFEEIKPPVIENREDFVKAVRASGLVGLGGAAFPTHVKYNPKNLDEVKTLVINGAECEPYITSDYRTMMEDTEYIVDGIKAIMKYLEIDQCFIGIEENKMEAIEALSGLLTEESGINIVQLDSQFPKGAERVLIFETTGKTLNPGQLPAEIGVLVSNVTSVSFLGKYLETGMPLIEKRITVDGSAVETPKNLFVPIGTMIYEIMDYCGGYKKPVRKLLMGGPMMGRAIYDDGKPLIKNNNAILAFEESCAAVADETQCINCGRCVAACPAELMPTSICKEFEKSNAEGLDKLKVMACMECGCCSYVCPAKKQLSLVNKLAKALVKEAQQNAN